MGDNWKSEIPVVDSAADDWHPALVRLVGDSPFVALTIFLIWWMTTELGKRLDGIHRCLDDLKEEIRRIKL
jgi:hypothetical protein